MCSASSDLNTMTQHGELKHLAAEDVMVCGWVCRCFKDDSTSTSTSQQSAALSSLRQACMFYTNIWS